MNTARVLFITMVLAMMYATPAPAAAQGCNLKAAAGCGSGTGRHKTQSGGSGAGTPHAEQCYTCYSGAGGEPIDADKCHQCGFESGDEYALLLDAVENGTVDDVVNAASRAARHVVLNYERSALQVRSCHGEWVIAHIPVSSAQLIALSLDLRGKVALAPVIGTERPRLGTSIGARIGAL
jgi:hypothetical protein